MAKKKYKIGDEYPVWWETNDGRPAGQHMARIIEIKTYEGIYDFTYIFRLTCPGTRRGWMEMAVTV